MTEPELFEHFAEIAWKYGRPDIALECLRRARAAHPPAQHEKAAQIHHEALQYLAAGDLARAENKALRAIQLHSTESSWYDHLGVIWARQQRWLDAVEAFKMATRLNRNNFSAAANHLQVLVDSGNVEHYQMLAEQLHTAHPPLDLMLKIIQGWASLKHFAQAEESLKSYLGAAPDVWELHHAAAVIYMTQQKYVQAKVHFAKVVELVPENADIMRTCQLFLVN